MSPHFYRGRRTLHACTLQKTRNPTYPIYPKECALSELSVDGIRHIMITRLNLDMDPEEIRMDDSLLEDLGLDSVDLLEVAIGIEKTYKIKITQQDTEAFLSVRSLYAFALARRSHMDNNHSQPSGALSPA
ncbi:acyl carrier protein [Diaminobutyricibacter sp. McL0618]|uniref:acyl carrier protein n=1 Tax=Leifsonia sp. McL0618 TaxID=3415677 RepID=UPI003CF9BFC8